MKKISLAICCIFFSAQLVIAQSPLTDLTKEIVFPFDTTSAESSFITLKPLFTSRKIIALGEATHGTLEFTTIRIQLLKYLIRDCNYRTIILESSFNSMLFLNDYVTEGKGEADSLLRRAGYWMFYTSEFRDFINWIKDFNKDQPLTSRVNLLGMDIHNLNDGPAYIRHRSGILPPDLRQSLDSAMRPLQQFDLNKPIVSGYTSTSDKEQLLKAHRGLSAWMMLHEIELTAILTAREKLFWTLCLDNLKYGIMQPHDGNYRFRDSCMFINARVLIDSLDKRTVIWGHNQHIAREDEISGLTPFRMMAGERLHQQYKQEYYPVGFLFNTGSYLATAVVQKQNKISFPYFSIFKVRADKRFRLSNALAAKSNAPFFIDLENSQNSVWQQSHLFYTAGAVAPAGAGGIGMTPAKIFGGIVYVPSTSPIVQLDDFFKKTVF